MGRKPVAIEDGLWRVFETHGLVRPFEDFWQSMLNDLKCVKIETSFGKNLAHALEACLSSLPFQVGTETAFYKSSFENIGINWDSGKWKIDASYALFETWHTNDNSFAQNPAACREHGSSFTCDHVIPYILDDMLFRLSGSHEKGLATSSMRQRLVGTSLRKLLMMPRSICLGTNGDRNSMVVSWTLYHISSNPVGQIRVSLHPVTCPNILNSPKIYRTTDGKLLLYQLSGKSLHGPATCACPVQVVPSTTTTAKFTNLDPLVSYLPMVCFDAEGAFYGLPPSAMSPSSRNLLKLSEAERKTNLMDVESIQPKPVMETIADLFIKPASATANSSENSGSSDKAPVIDTKVQPLGVKDLPWDENFPAAYDWIQAENAGSHVLIAKPKVKTDNEDKKRGLEHTAFDTATKKPRISGEP